MISLPPPGGDFLGLARPAGFVAAAVVVCTGPGSIPTGVRATGCGCRMIGSLVIGSTPTIGCGEMMMCGGVHWKKNGSIDGATGVVLSVLSSVCVVQLALRW